MTTQPLTPAPEDELWRTYRQSRGQADRDRLFAIHYPFAREVARHHFRDRRSGDIELADLCQLAGVGLLEAIDRYDPDRGVPFEAFARRRLRGAILDGLPRLSERREQEAFKRQFRSERTRSLVIGGGQTSADDALAALVEAAVGLAIGFMLEDEALLQSPGAADRSGSPYQSTAWNQTTDRLREALQTLPEREREILKRHYFQGMDFQRIGDELDLSKGRISQIHRSALNLLRKRLRRVAAFEPRE